jgi:hypothetical protein
MPSNITNFCKCIETIHLQKVDCTCSNQESRQQTVIVLHCKLSLGCSYNKLGVCLFRVRSEEEYFQGQGQGKYKSMKTMDL